MEVGTGVDDSTDFVETQLMMNNYDCKYLAKDAPHLCLEIKTGLKEALGQRSDDDWEEEDGLISAGVDETLDEWEENDDIGLSDEETDAVVYPVRVEEDSLT